MILFNQKYLFILLFILLETPYSTRCILRRRYARNVGVINGHKGISAPLLSDQIDLETIKGIEQVTKLVLTKTDSLPSESDETIDGRYLNSLMETLYTGLRKPFKSVSADILGIFPSFEEIQVRCEQPNSNDHLEKDESIIVKRWATNKLNENGGESYYQQLGETLKSDERRNETMNLDSDSNYVTPVSYKSSLKVCEAVTNDCLSAENLVQILPPTISKFDKALVRLCPIMLFRIMNHLCQKSSNSLNNRNQDEFISAYQSNDESRETGQSHKNDSISLNTLIRETQILKTRQEAKKPQKLHKKLKTQTPYKGSNRLQIGNSQQHGSVDEQLLKIRLKLTEPSIEKVWIFSLLFVILSIVVSMGGLIVLPFVKKTTRRRILTLFEGLAVGGLAGSATLHMFPQAFGLVDENYHKYFWRIFVVFFGIYLCYLCERIMKILKVMRARTKRRSRASLVDMDFFYGFPSVSQGISRNRSRSSRILDSDQDCEPSVQSSLAKKRKIRKSLSGELDPLDVCEDCIGSKYINKQRGSHSTKDRRTSKKKDRKLGGNLKYMDSKHGLSIENMQASINDCTDIDTPIGIGQSNPTRQRLIHCLKSVQSQFTPVYAVQTQIVDSSTTAQDEPRAGKFLRLKGQQDKSRKSKKLDKQSTSSKNRIFDSSPIFGKTRGDSKSSIKKSSKQRDIETMLYHNRMSNKPGQDGTNWNRGYLQQRLSSVNDVAAERQDQDNAARMSVDTVAWMIVFGDAVLNVIDGLSIGAAFERNILAGISISVAVMLEEVTHRLGTFAVLIRAGMSMQQSLLCTFLSACALFPGLIVGILLSDATEDATPYIFCAAGGIFLYMALVDVMKEMNRSIENAIRKDIKSTLQIFALQNVGIILAVVFLSFLALYEQAMDFEEYQIQYNQPSK